LGVKIVIIFIRNAFFRKKNQRKFIVPGEKPPDAASVLHFAQKSGKGVNEV
jgi:hypothetical protein